MLHAIVAGETKLTSDAVLTNYELRNSLVVQRAKKALVGLDIIDDFGNTRTLATVVVSQQIDGLKPPILSAKL